MAKYKTLLETPKVYINEDIDFTIKEIVKECDEEVGWLMSCRREEQDFIIYRLFLLEQTVSSVKTELSEKALANLAEELLANNEEEDMNNIRAWGHSHVYMAPTPSLQDDDTFEEYGKDCEYFIRLIINKKGKYTLCLWDKENNIIWEDLEYTILPVEDLLNKDKVARVKELEEEYEKLSSEIKSEYEKSLKEWKDNTKENIKNECKNKIKKDTYKYTKSNKSTKKEKNKKPSFDFNYYSYGYEEFEPYVTQTDNVVRLFSNAFTEREVELLALYDCRTNIKPNEYIKKHNIDLIIEDDNEFYDLVDYANDLLGGYYG